MTVLINPDRYELEDADVPTTIFAFDLDSVLSDTSYLPRAIAAKFGVTEQHVKAHPDTPYEKFQYNIEGVSNNQMYKVIHEAVNLHSPGALTTPYMYEVLEYYHLLTGDPIVVVTARSRDNAAVTDEWLSRNLKGIPYYAIICHGVPKVHVLKDLGVEYFVDDRLKTIIGLQGEINHPILYQHPWNQGRPYWEMYGVNSQIRDLRDLVPIFNIEAGHPPARWPKTIPYPKRV